MKIAFHIPRLNWYRVFSPAIDEALRRGHHVECWHDAGNEGLKDNAPLKERVPFFRFGAPVVREYISPEELLELACYSGVDAVLDVRPPPEALLKRWFTMQQRPKWILHVAADSLYTIRTRKEMLACDQFAVRTSTEMEAVIEDRQEDKSEWVTKLDSKRKLFGPWLCDYQKKVWRLPWDKEMVAHARQRTVAVGTPSLDVLRSLNRNEIRRRWNIPLDKPVIGYLPCPYGLAFGAYWEKLFMTTSWWKHAWVALSHGQPQDMVSQVNDQTVVKGLRVFCDNNDAWLIAKQKHSTEAAPYVRKAANLVVSDDCFYPHTAVEVYAISDLVIGHYSSGSVEAVAAGTFYLDIGIPHFPSDFINETFALYRGMFNTPGVTRTLPASAFVNGLSGFELSDFMIDANRASGYLEKYVGSVDGQSSQRLLQAVEQAVVSRN